MSKKAIPQVPRPKDDRYLFDMAIKENIEVITGRRDTPLQRLRPTATQDEIISAINNIIDRLQG